MYIRTRNVDITVMKTWTKLERLQYSLHGYTRSMSCLAPPIALGNTAKSDINGQGLEGAQGKKIF